MVKVRFFKLNDPRSSKNGWFFALAKVDRGPVIHEAELPSGGEWAELPGAVLFRWVELDGRDGLDEVAEADVPTPLPTELRSFHAF